MRWTRCFITGWPRCWAARDRHRWRGRQVDIEETEQDYVIRAELPGLDKDKVKVTVEDGVLTLSGERDLERGGGETYHRIERSHGTFSRSFTLPEDSDAESVAAQFTNGVLAVRVAKREEALPKSIEVRVE